MSTRLGRDDNPAYRSGEAKVESRDMAMDLAYIRWWADFTPFEARCFAALCEFVQVHFEDLLDRNYWEGHESLNDFPAWPFERYQRQVEQRGLRRRRRDRGNTHVLGRATERYRLLGRLWPVPGVSLLTQLSEGDAMNWRWNTEPLSWKDKCSMCEQPLRVQGGGGIVIWTDSKHYHVCCLLDRLALSNALAPMATADSVSHWGIMP